MESLKLDKEAMVLSWVDYYRKIEAMFGKDPQIRIELDEDAPEIQMFVENPGKADAISQLLPVEKIFGNITLKIKVIPSNGCYGSETEKFEKAFEGNPAFSYAATIADGIFTNPINFIVFKKEVVQYYNDDLVDVNGIRSTLYQDLARELFGDRYGTFYCTDNK